MDMDAFVSQCPSNVLLVQLQPLTHATLACPMPV